MAAAVLTGVGLALAAVSASRLPAGPGGEAREPSPEYASPLTSITPGDPAAAARASSAPVAPGPDEPAVTSAAAKRAAARARRAPATALGNRIEAVYALGDSRDPRAVEQLGITLAADRRPEVRTAAVGTLVVIGNDEAALALGQLLVDADARIRNEAVHGLAEIGSEAAVEMLQHALADRDPGIREAAAEYLEAFAASRHGPPTPGPPR